MTTGTSRPDGTRASNGSNNVNTRPAVENGNSASANGWSMNAGGNGKQEPNLNGMGVMARWMATNDGLQKQIVGEKPVKDKDIRKKVEG
ncbi:hypothetical protein LTR09_004628 [Extremus antarcticus]|uniref:Uncharacterized protein n=1 Tax=Extremus antarcticus TaxID=702011 RepID=A0AAJ0GDU9_9PEZI|nr:hypothetical protein LTR09_004628 [Extremus antarcticus]